MTHGVSHHSGGHHGGGHHRGSHHRPHNHSRTASHQRRPHCPNAPTQTAFHGGYQHGDPVDTEESCGSCCICICSGIGFLLCINTKSYQQRLCILWFWTLVVIAVPCCVLAAMVFNSDTFSTTPLDMRTVTREGYSVFCEKITLSADYQFNAWLLDSHPHIAPGQTHQVVQPEISPTVYPQENLQWHFYMIGQAYYSSSINVDICVVTYNFGRGVFLYIIKGNNNLDKWKNDHDCNCVEKTTYIPVQNSCLNPSDNTFVNFYITSDHPDEYHFVFYNDDYNYPVTLSNLKFDVHRLTYDVEENEDHCSGLQCTFDLSVKSMKESVVYKAEANSPFGEDIVVECATRLPVYLSIATIPFIFSFLITFCVVCSVRHKTRGDCENATIPTVSGAVTTSQRAALVQSELPPSYDSIYDENIVYLPPPHAPVRVEPGAGGATSEPPPPYATVPTESPPSYSEASDK